MKTTGHLIIYISESEDFELWRALSQISPEERSALVQSVLKKALLQGNDSRNSASLGKNKNLRPNRNLPDDTIGDMALDELGYSSLAAANEKVLRKYNSFEQDDNSLTLDDLLQSDESMKKGPLPGLDFLLTNVIGEENDKEMIEFIRNTLQEIQEDKKP